MATQQQIEAAARAGSPLDFIRMESAFEAAKIYFEMVENGCDEPDDTKEIAVACEHKGNKMKARLFDQYRAALTAAEAVEEPVKPHVWDIEEYKIWKGIDKQNPVWASLGFACPSYDDAVGLMDYMCGNKQTAVMRVCISALEEAL